MYVLMTYISCLDAVWDAKGIATSRTTPYNPEGNGQIERFNGIIWKGVNLATKSRNLRIEQWEKVLPDVLHSVRSLLCTATNCTPHELMFKHNRRSTSGTSLPSWLTPNNTVFLKRHVRQSKYDPVVDEVELLHVNPEYATVRFNSGRESTVSLKHLAPRGIVREQTEKTEGEMLSERVMLPCDAQTQRGEDQSTGDSTEEIIENSELSEPEIPPGNTQDSVNAPARPEIRQSTRSRHPPKYLSDYVK